MNREWSGLKTLWALEGQTNEVGHSNMEWGRDRDRRGMLNSGCGRSGLTGYQIGRCCEQRHEEETTVMITGPKAEGGATALSLQAFGDLRCIREGSLEEVMRR